MTMGDVAAENCDEFGWGPSGKVDPSLVAETFQSPGFGYGRAWSRSSSYMLRGDARALYLVFTVEGGIEFTVNDEAFVTAPGEMVFLDGNASTFATTLANTATARYVWFLRPAVLDIRSSRFALHDPLQMTNMPMQSLIALTNAMLNSGDRLSSPAHGRMGLAAEHLLVAALDETPVTTDTHAMHRDGLFSTAQLILDNHFRDPNFGTIDLARELSVSRSRLHALFAAFGTTPRREIERRRLNVVRQFQSTTPSLGEVVQDAGFLSIRTYRSALARSRAAGSPPPPPPPRGTPRVSSSPARRRHRTRPGTDAALHRRP